MHSRDPFQGHSSGSSAQAHSTPHSVDIPHGQGTGTGGAGSYSSTAHSQGAAASRRQQGAGGAQARRQRQITFHAPPGVAASPVGTISPALKHSFGHSRDYLRNPHLGRDPYEYVSILISMYLKLWAPGILF